MSRWAGTCELVSELQTRDKRGVVSVETKAREVPCNVFSISAATFYAASSAGVRPQAIIEIRACAYKGETLVNFDGSLLCVERVEKSLDNVRLTLVDRTCTHEKNN